MKNKVWILLLGLLPGAGAVKTINCKGISKTIAQAYHGNDPSKRWARTVTLPLSGRFTIEAHYVTDADSFANGYPASEKEEIARHLNRSLALYQAFDSAASFQSLYRYNNAWTPMEHGKFGQGSIGDGQNKLLEPSSELWMMNMMWAAGSRPPLNTKFLLSYNGRNVVVVAGYETGPSDEIFLGGVTGEVHSWLRSTVRSKIMVTYLEDQSAMPGPCNCQ